jgi:hypothetical protein
MKGRVIESMVSLPHVMHCDATRSSSSF